MSPQSKLVTLALICLIAIGSGVYWQTSAKQAIKAGFTTISGQTIQLDQLLGKPVIVTFWASDCPSCLEEIPQWISLHQEFAAQGLTIIAVAMAYDPPNKVVELAKQKNLPYAIALDPDGTLAQKFDVELTPSSFLINPQGKVEVQKIGLIDLPQWQQKIRNWL